MSSLEHFFDYAFLTRALIAGVLMSVTCGLLSPFVLLRRLSFSADGLAHASLGGLALGMFLLATGPAPTLASYAISFVFTCVVAAGIAYFSGSQRVHADTAVGACYVAAFALGILLLSMRKYYTGHLEHFVFGSLLAVNTDKGGIASELKLDSPPVWDGMAVAHGRIFIVTTDGKIQCYGQPKRPEILP